LQTHYNILQHSTPHCNTSREWRGVVTHCNTYCNILHHTATHCNILHHTATHCNTLQHISSMTRSWCTDQRLQHTTTQCNTLQHTATHCNTLRLISSMKQSLLQHSATHCNTLQHTATHCDSSHQWRGVCYNNSTLQHTTAHCNTLQHTTTHCNTLQHTSLMTRSLVQRPTAPVGFFISAWINFMSSLGELYCTSTTDPSTSTTQQLCGEWRVRVCCSVRLQCVAVCCSVKETELHFYHHSLYQHYSTTVCESGGLGSVAVCRCSVLQCVAVWRKLSCTSTTDPSTSTTQQLCVRVEALVCVAEIGSVAVYYCSVLLQCTVAVYCCSVFVVCCSVNGIVMYTPLLALSNNCVWEEIFGGWCSVLQYVAVHCGVLQCEGNFIALVPSIHLTCII